MSSKINRRGFLRGSAAVGTLALAARRGEAKEKRAAANVPAPRRGPNEEIRVACVGIRGQGRHHIAWHASVKNVRVVTICDVDENLFADRIKLAGERTPKTETDLRRAIDDKDVDCISIATPNHWHALATVWACQASKDVYVEKPGSYNIAEGRKMIEAAHEYGRIVQHGTHIRANQSRQRAIQTLRDGIVGEIYMARAFIYNRRKSIGVHPDEPAPPKGVNYDLWLGPAPARPFNKNRFHYQWHWNWAYGNGEIGNNGVHMSDIAVEGLDKQSVHPVRVHSLGGRFVYNDQGETPNTQVTSYQYEDGTVLELAIRNLESNKEWESGEGVFFFGEKGYMLINIGSFRTMIDGQPGPKGSGGGGAHPEHIHNFHEAVRSRKVSDLLAPIEYGHYASALCHLGNISYRLGRSLEFDPKTESFGKDSEANAMLTRDYRKPFVMPEKV